MINPERKNKIEDILRRKQPKLEVFLDNLSSSQNISAIIRSCDGVGVLNLYYATPDNLDLRIHKTITQGTHRWINKTRIDAASKIDFITSRQAEGYQVVATHLSHKSVSFSAIDYTKPTMLIMGNEKDGVSDEVIALADEVVIIPMRGMAQSLNVSVATALILYEAGRQLDAIGAYDTPQLQEAQINSIMEEWIYRDTIRHRSKGKIFY